MGNFPSVPPVPDGKDRSKKKCVVDAWSMSQKSEQEYDLDLEVAFIHLTFEHEWMRVAR